MKNIDIDGVRLSEKAINTIQDWQDDNNYGIIGACDNIDEVCFHLTNPDCGMSDADTLGLVSALLFFKKQLKTLAKEVNEDGK